MDIALCQDILRQAEKSGAEKAFILSRSCIVRSDRLANHQVSSSIDKTNISRLYVQVGTGCCSVLMSDGSGPAVSRELMMEYAAKCCQAARLAKAWGQARNEAELEFRRFDSEKVLCERVDSSCADSSVKNACADGCFRPECIEGSSLGLSERLQMLEQRVLEVNPRIEFDAEFRVQSIDESLYQGNEVQRQQHFESSIRQGLCCRHGDDECRIHLPEYRFVGQVFDPLKHAELISAAETAEFFEKSCMASDDYVQPETGILVSGWGMSVIGHETSHLHVDISPGGRVVMNLSECMNQPVQAGYCLSNGIRISLEGGLKKNELITRVPAHTLVVDAPDAWIRRNESILDVRFRTAYSIQNGAFERAYKPVILRFDLRRIWYYCRFASKPYVRMAVKCGNGGADFQAPWAYFEMKPEFGHF